MTEANRTYATTPAPETRKGLMEASMKPRIDLTISELDALEGAARSARAREVSRLIRAGVDELVRHVRHSARGLLCALASPLALRLKKP